MDYPALKKFPDCRATRQLTEAKESKRGATFEPLDLEMLIKCTESAWPWYWQCQCPACSSDEMTYAAQLLAKADNAVNAKRILSLTSGDVIIWCLLLSNIEEHSIRKEIYVLDSSSRSTQEDEDTTTKLMNKVLECRGNNKGLSLDRTEAYMLLGEYGLLEEQGRIQIPLDDPENPFVTSQNKFSRAARTSSTVQLEPEEVSCLDKVFGQRAIDELKNRIFATPSRSASSTTASAPAPPKPAPSTTRQRPTPSTSSTSPKNTETHETMSADKILKDLVARYNPSAATSVLNSNQPMVTRWVKPIETILKALDTKSTKAQGEADRMRLSMLETEDKYEKELDSARQAHELSEAVMQCKLAKAEEDFKSKSEAFDKQNAIAEKKHKEQLQIDSELYSRLKSEKGEEVAKLELALGNAKNEVKELKREATKAEAQRKVEIQSRKNEISILKGKLKAEISNAAILNLDFEAVLADKTILQDSYSQMTEREAKCAALESELAALRSSRTNPQIEKDNIARAVRNATSDKQKEIDQTQASLQKTQVALDKTQAALDQAQVVLDNAKEALAKANAELRASEATIKEKDEKIASLEFHISAVMDVLHDTETELMAARCQLIPDPEVVQRQEQERAEQEHREGNQREERSQRMLSMSAEMVAMGEDLKEVASRLRQM